MRKGIVVTTSEHTKDWLRACLESLPAKHPVLVVSNGGYVPNRELGAAWIGGAKAEIDLVVNDWNGFELGGILRGAERFDEFVHLMDTCVVTDPEMIERMFAHDGSMYLCDGFFSYLGKYRTEVLGATGIPRIGNKSDAIGMESAWNAKYLRNDPRARRFDPPLPIHTGVFEHLHGRRNMVLDNGFIRKWKATWSL